MRKLAAFLVTVLVLVSSSGSAQSPVPSQAPAIDVTVLEQLCETNAASDEERDTCLDVVHNTLVPGSGPAAPSALAGAATVGTTLSRDDADVTILKADWSPDVKLYKPDPGNRFVSVLVRIEATQDGAAYNPLFWSATDPDGFEYNASLLGAKPSLQSSNDLPDGKRVQGWVTFQVPKATKSVDVIESVTFGPELRWTISR